MSIRKLRAPKKPVTVAKARQLFRVELVRTDAAFNRHIKKNGCTSDACPTRARYQERVKTLQYVLDTLGARGMKDKYITTIEEL